MEDKLDMKHKNFSDALKRIHLVYSCDHGQGALRCCLKILFIDAEKEDGKVIGQSEYNVGLVDCTKDDYETLKQTIIPKFDKMMENLMKDDSYFRIVISAAENPANNVDAIAVPTPVYFSNSAEDVHHQNITGHKIRVKCFISSDYKLYSDVLGKHSRSGHYCPFCKVNKRERVQRKVGVKWTCENMKQTYDLRSEDISINRGVVEECLLPSIARNRERYA